MTESAPTTGEHIHSISIASIDATGRLRQVDPARVQVIADSILANRRKAIGRSGLEQPIVVRAAGDTLKLVIGAHRLAACTLIGDTDIDALLRDMDEFEARISEIDENLCRAELTMYDRAAFLAERDHVWKCMHPELAGRGKAAAAARWHHATENFSFASGIADKVGLADAEIRKNVKMWRALSPESRARIPNTWLADHQAQLRALAKLGPQQQAAVLAVLLRDDGPADNVAAALAEIEGRTAPAQDPVDKAYLDLVSRWARAPAAAKARFQAFLAAETAGS